MLELHQRQCQAYAITMRKTTKPDKVNESTYINQMNYFKSYLGAHFETVRFELTGGLHMHGIVSIPKSANLVRFRVRGWSIRLEEIYDLDGWNKYINKDNKDNKDSDEDSIDDIDFVWPIKKLF